MFKTLTIKRGMVVHSPFFHFFHSLLPPFLNRYKLGCYLFG